jgi:PKD repeat protein
MKTIIKITTLLMLTMSITNGNAQTLTICAGNNTVINAINSLGLTNPSYSVNPGGITSQNPAFTVSPNATVVYTLFTTGTNSNAVNVTTSNTVMVQVQSPAIGNISVSQNTLTCTTPTALVQVTPNSSQQYSWLPSSVQGNSIIVTSNTAAPSQSILTTLTLVVIDTGNMCQSTTLIPIYQNVYLPNTAINTTQLVVPTNPACLNKIFLVNVSASGVPASLFPNSNVLAILWAGPTPQPTLAYSSTYTAQTPGIYTMTGMETSNGCTKTATFHISPSMLLKAAFIHTITGGQAIFNSVSSGTGTYTSSGTPTSTSYFWDFGDGNSSTLQNPSHTYTNAGAYFVKLKIKNVSVFYACSDSVIQSVAISGVPCSANSNFSMVPTNTAQVWSVIPNFPWNVTAANWNWGDGSSSSTLFTSHQYSAAGMYNICLSVTVSCAASSSTCTSYSVYRVSQEDMILSVNVVAPELISGLSGLETDMGLLWNIIPNPNTGEFKLNLGNTKSELLRVFISDFIGRIVYDQTIESDSNSINIHADNLLPGMYFVTLKSDKMNTTKRMVVYH